MLTSILILSVFFIVYAVFHSLLASSWFKGWIRRRFGPGSDRWYRLFYNIVAVITLLPLFPMLALLPDRILYIVPSPWRWLMVGGQLLALTGLGVALLQTDPWHFLGLSQLISGQPVEMESSGSLTVKGFYCWVRHPLYFFSLLFLWLTPAMTVNLLVTYLLFTLYFYIGSIHEERRLVSEFGRAYRAYQQQVPRLIPRPWRCYRQEKETATV
jgi:protein-S-isoprenylcysteine O-methyltransferase Ste14